ncbi:helix-turn-helix transcriptional regulator [Arthrobacter sp. CJ23]|uniref:helix-turn-helix domain-containing protein n=1 Tax=Arthrobacter sp. CJ23 TaxID=2972479 RepID=UPI00215D2E17|nr:helix-turn-helix transcriptional regulator [Arthrobacter sp. CJ23]UVJ39766.1 helix-turn-helix domain-containing protein [Arthrobacter sp. CJ23]
MEHLAELSGVSDRTISDIERGVSTAPQRRTLLALVGALKLTDAEQDEFLGAARAGKITTAAGGRSASLEPRRLPDFTGRTSEMAELLAFLEVDSSAQRTVAPVAILHGAPGMGKTAMAVEALHRRQENHAMALFVDLNGLDAFPLTPLQVLQALLKQALPSGRQVPKTLASAASLWREVSADSPVAVLLDNAASEAQVRPVLTTGHRGVVVVTSRRSLAGLEGVRRFPLGPLPPSDSEALLAEIVSAGQRGAPLKDLAVLCDQIPLALRIAGNRLASQPAWTVSDFLDRLRSEERRLRALVAGDLAVEAAFSLSYGHLDEEHKQLFRNLSLLKGATFSAPLAGAAMAGANTAHLGSAADVEERLDELVDLGLVQALTGSRYRLHDLLRLYAAGRLRAETSAEDIAAHRAHLRAWLLTSTVNAGNWFEPHPAPGLIGGTPGMEFRSSAQARHWLQSETPDWFGAYQEAVTRHEHQNVVKVAESLHWFAGIWESWGNWHRLFADSVKSAAALGDQACHSAHLGYLSFAYNNERMDHERALSTALLAMDAAIGANNPTLQGWAYLYIALSYRGLGKIPEAMTSAEQAISLFEAVGEIEGQAPALMLKGSIHQAWDQLDTAVDVAAGLLTLVRSSRMPANVADFIEFYTLQLLCGSLYDLQRYEECIEVAGEALAVAEQMEWHLGRASALYHRGKTYDALNRHSLAAQDLSRALGQAVTAGDKRLETAIRQMAGEMKDKLAALRCDS